MTTGGPGATEESGVLYFGVDARHVRQLGQELVGDRITAVSELIKNSYDADAATVQLDFSRRPVPARSHKSEDAVEFQLTILDDGVGMTLDDMERGWMRISTDDKERNARSQRFLRPRAGRKGIGRFAAQTLGQHLELRTTVTGDDRELVVRFDWDEDYKSGLDLGEIPNAWHFEPTEASKHGTALIITGLYNRWARPDLDRVAKTVLLLQPPFPPPTDEVESQPTGDVDPGFRVTFRVDGESIETESIDRFLEAATAEVIGEVSANGVATMLFESGGKPYLIARRAPCFGGGFDLGLPWGSDLMRTRLYQGIYWATPKRSTLWSVDPTPSPSPPLADLSGVGDTSFGAPVPLGPPDLVERPSQGPLAPVPGLVRELRERRTSSPRRRSSERDQL